MSLDAAARLAAQKDAAFAALTKGGLHPDRDLVDMVDVSAIKVDDTGRTTLPPGFAESVKVAKPHLFAAATSAGQPRRAVDLGDFDARTASAADVAARFEELKVAARDRRFDALTGQALAKLEADDADRTTRQAARETAPAPARDALAHSTFDARTASPADFDRELKALSRSAPPYASHGAR